MDKPIATTKQMHQLLTLVCRKLNKQREHQNSFKNKEEHFKNYPGKME
jgi:hypothetical protein